MGEIFFEQSITNNFAKYIIDGTNKLVKNSYISSLKDCEIFFLENFNLYGRSNDELYKVGLFWANSFTLKSSIYPTSLFIYLWLHVKENSRDKLMKEWIDAANKKDFLFNNIENFKKKLENKYSEVILKSIPLVKQVLIKAMIIESDIKFNLNQKSRILNTTLEMLQKNTFNCIESNNDNIEYINILNNFDDKLKKSKIRNLLKKIKYAKCNYTSINDDGEEFYIHIYNIIYSYFNFTQILLKHKYLKNIPKKYFVGLNDSSSNTQFSNFDKNVSLFLNEVRSNQTLQYITLYYSYYHLNTIDIENFKPLVALMFDKENSKLFTKKLDISNITIPFDFVYYSSLQVNNESK